MATVADRLALGYTPKPVGSAVIPRPYVPNFTIPDPRIEAQYQRAAAEAAHGERVNPTAQKPTFAANDPRAYGDGRFGAPASQPTPTPAPKPLAAQAAQAPKGPFYQRPLGDMARGGASATGGLAKKAAGVFSAPAAVGLAGLAGAAQGFGTDTEQYAKRFGLENTEPGLLRDLGVRSLGVASDVGNALTLGLAGNLYRDQQDQAVSSPAVVPNPKLSPLAQMDPTSAAMKDPANPMKPQQGASAALASPSGAQEVRPGIFRQGNSFSDTAAGAAEGARPAPISAQNMAAADALAARYQSNPLVQQAEAQQGPSVYIGQDTGGYGLLDKNRIAVRNAMMDVQQMKPGSGTVLKALLQSQSDAPKLDIERQGMVQRGKDSAADRQMRSTELMAKMGESSADRALRSQEVADNSLVNAAKREQMGIETGAAKRLASLQDAYLNAKTPEEQAAAAAKINALSGKTNQDEYMAVAGGQTVDAMGNITKQPDLIVNKRTGQPVQGGQQAKPQGSMPPPNQRPVGATSTVNGKTAVWDGTKWVPQ